MCSLKNRSSVGSVKELTPWIVEQARQVGFDLCGVAPVKQFEELLHFRKWLARGYGGEMRYLEDSRRNSPSEVLSGAKSLIVCALNYHTPLPYSTEVPLEAVEGATVDGSGRIEGPRGWLSRYAWGDDYHEIVAQKLEALVTALRTRCGEALDVRAYVDTGPVAERVAAKYAGLGWLAKNTCLIHPQLGSWLFLAVILTTLELPPSLGPERPPPDLCGNCRLCIDACPTGALVEPYVLDARRCISYLTIELRGAIPEQLRRAAGRHVFGCDICQEVCPWNRQAPVTTVKEFFPRQVASDAGPVEKASPAESLFAPSLEWLASLSDEDFRRVFKNSAVKRTKRRGLLRNVCVALGNSGVRPNMPAYRRVLTLLNGLARSPDTLVAEHARWALRQLDSSEAMPQPGATP